MSLEIEGRVKPSRSRASVNTQITLVEDVRRELPEVGGGLRRTERAELKEEIRSMAVGGGLWEGHQGGGTAEMGAEAGEAWRRPLDVRLWKLYLTKAEREREREGIKIC